MLPEELQILEPAVEAVYVSGTLDDQVRQNARIDEMKIDDEVVAILDERPVHVGEPVDDHQQDAEARADTHHQPREQRETDQQMPVLDEERCNRRHRRRRENNEHVVESLRVIEEPDHGPIGYEHLMRSGVEERPRHDETKIENQALFHR